MIANEWHTCHFGITLIVFVIFFFFMLTRLPRSQCKQFATEKLNSLLVKFLGVKVFNTRQTTRQTQKPVCYWCWCWCYTVILQVSCNKLNFFPLDFFGAPIFFSFSLSLFVFTADRLWCHFLIVHAILAHNLLFADGSKLLGKCKNMGIMNGRGEKKTNSDGMQWDSQSVIA